MCSYKFDLSTLTGAKIACFPSLSEQCLHARRVFIAFLGQKRKKQNEKGTTGRIEGGEMGEMWQGHIFKDDVYSISRLLLLQRRACTG